jgi:hypothetical protein
LAVMAAHMAAAVVVALMQLLPVVMVAVEQFA